VVADRSFEQTAGQSTTQQPPAQRKTTLKWDDNGELTSIDMARIIDRLTQPELNRCDLDTP
jgi:YD repeat-containing protein|tara:strand:- start:592 stop:774 length:183 start_codon:yes stop_codon:yes gene_type:complete